MLVGGKGPLAPHLGSRGASGAAWVGRGPLEAGWVGRETPRARRGPLGVG